jgi:mono/diheme cytochrome c family protein
MKNMTCLFVIYLLFSCGNVSNNKNEEDAQPAANDITLSGEQIYKTNCAQCHMKGEGFIAPSLEGVEKRWTNKQLLYDFVKNSQTVIQNDEYSKTLFKKWNQTLMQPFPDLTSKEIDDIFAYCNDAASVKN